MKVLFDTNVLIDVLAQREPFFADSAQVWTLAERGSIQGFVSVISFNNIYYIVRKLRSRRTAERMMTLLRDTFSPVALDDQILHQAMDARFKDFEDAIQYFSAIRAHADCIVTRNVGHFPPTDVAALTPRELLAARSL
jgi:predicted nucleic acid-binding protein